MTTKKNDKYTPLKDINAEIINNELLNIKPIDIPNYNLNEGLPPEVPQHPSFLYITGTCGKGKTNLMVWMLLFPFLQFFNSIYIFSGTIHQDIWKTIKLDYDKCFEEYSDQLFQKVKQDIIDNQDDKTLIIIDDMTGGTVFNKRNSPLVEFVCNRRHKPSSWTGCSMWFVSHGYKSVPKVLRSVIDDLIVYETSSADELEVIVTDNRGRLSANDFMRYIYDIATKEEYSFLYIKRRTPFNSRFRINFDIILKLDI